MCKSKKKIHVYRIQSLTLVNLNIVPTSFPPLNKYTHNFAFYVIRKLKLFVSLIMELIIENWAVFYYTRKITEIHSLIFFPIERRP